MALDFSALKIATDQLEKSLAYGRSELAASDPELAHQFRAAAIQAFEFTYELCWKMLKRHLEATLPNPAEADEMSFAELIRTGNEHDLLRSSWPAWANFRKARGTTSHTYDELKAAQVFELIPDFLEEACFLLRRLQEREENA